jgi:hypothetical protein
LRFSTHYYVLSLSERRNRLYEAFRDSLIEVENHGFPVIGASGPPKSLQPELRLELGREVDRCFGQYQSSEPLKFVVVGARAMLDVFQAVTMHSDALVGKIEGDHTATGVRDLGQIVWPLIKEAMSGVLNGAMRDLYALAERRSVVSGLEAVARAADGQRGPTLLVEDDYHVRGSIVDIARRLTISADVDVRATIDDIVDLVIERVLGAEGDVIFVPPGTLGDWKRIALLLRDGRSEEPTRIPETKPQS